MSTEFESKLESLIIMFFAYTIPSLYAWFFMNDEFWPKLFNVVDSNLTFFNYEYHLIVVYKSIF